ncbi:trypsin-like serine peptidase [Nitrincola alkalilacustris]|uniref:trypsin-like serine peptidase n=1 Tax=Nitrincola alkalilacustris TaxID=1571224 RepID=UPI00124E1139|nr:serine protease [Nitrincola alkalilacustris]
MTFRQCLFLAALWIPGTAQATESHYESAPFIPHQAGLGEVVKGDLNISSSGFKKSLKGLEFAPPSTRVTLQLRPVDEFDTHSPEAGSADEPSEGQLKAFKVGDGYRTVDFPYIDLASLDWVSVASGGFRSVMDLSIPGQPSAFRIGLSPDLFPEGVELYLYSPLLPVHYYGPFTADMLSKHPSDETYWLPVVEGGLARLELYIDHPAQLALKTLEIDYVSVLHDSVISRHLKSLDEVGAAGSCHRNVSCDADSLLLSDTTAKYLITSSFGSTYMCTGMLLNDAVSSQEPWFATANHCVGRNREAASMQFYWRFRSASCTSNQAITPLQTTIGGGDLLATDSILDVSFLRLNERPPVTARAGWTSSPQSLQTSVRGIHHPRGDLQKLSSGRIIDTDYWDRPAFPDTHWVVRWSTGAVESGSSGSGIFNGNNQLVGILTGGSSSCTFQSAPDYYGRFDLAYPELREWLVPDPVDTDRVLISGSVSTMMAQPTPVCAMVLINGQHMFSCDGQGGFELDVPLDANGEITIFAFADGFAPFRAVIRPAAERITYQIPMQADYSAPPFVSVESLTVLSGNRARATGRITTQQGVPLCSMVLINGQHMFTCDGEGRFDLTVPRAADGSLTLFSFVDGFAPFRQVYNGF